MVRPIAQKPFAPLADTCPVGLLPSGLKQILLVVAGVCAFLVVNAVLFLGRCSSTEFMINCSGGRGTNTWHVLGIGGFVIVAAFATKAGRAFAKGFFGALIVLGVSTMGACTTPWADPVFEVRRAIRPYQERWAKERKQSAIRRDWIAAMNSRSMDLARGIELAGAVVNCVQVHLTAKGRVTPTIEELGPGCRYLADFGASMDPGWPLRYEIPVERGLDQFGQTQEAVRGDAGWRVNYSATASGYSVDAAPEGLLNHRWPRIHADEKMQWEVRLAENAPPLSLTPVADLKTMAACLKGIPAEEERRRVQRVLGSWHLTPMAKRLCSGLAPRLRPQIQSDENASLLSIHLPAGPNGGSIPALTYLVEFVIRQPANSPFAFDIHAKAETAGFPRYLATFEGTVHQTTDNRPATAQDPVVR